MVKLKVLPHFNESDKEQINLVLQDITSICKKLDELELNVQNKSNENSKLEIKKNWKLLKKAAQEIDYIFDF